VEGYDTSTSSALNLPTHYLDEGMRFAYGQRTFLSDPTFSANISAYQRETYAENTAKEIRAKIKEFHTLNISSYDPSRYDILTDSGTSAVVASDKSRLTIALTSTINTLFGSQVMVPETGVIMNNEMNGIYSPSPYSAFHILFTNPT
jgi:gamma-glutamyltranspeptidase/glutathione hydrolase